MVLKINIITIFPDFFKNAFSYSILKRAQEKGIIEINILNIRDWSEDNYQTIDEKPYGGGAGMVMMLPPVYKALKSLNFPKNVILPSAKGKIWNQNMALEFAEFDEMTFVVPHFEGIDERVTEHLVDYQVSIGSYILSGGELPSMCIVDSVVRLLNGALGNPESIVEESFKDENYLEYPQYTRPQNFVTDDGEEWSVPEILLSGDHKKIKEWRESKSMK